ncbi:MAG TPA: histidine kinase [Pyrinomonadaceae bacterium]|nr:histidine kinase [Pyrinomonadaceae bacterium]
MGSVPQNFAGLPSGIDSTIVAFTRFFLAFCALLIIFVDPTEPDRLVSITYAVLIFYSGYSLVVYLGIQFNKPLPSVVVNHYWWIDTAFYLVLISLSSGTSSIFFFFFFFAVLTAAFACGFRTGFAVAIVSSVGFSILALFTTPGGAEFDLGRYLIRPMSLLMLGYLMSRWGASENRSLRRLELLRQIGAVSNPRFGVDRTIMVNLDLIRAFYDADACLFVARDPASDEIKVHHSAGLHSSQYPNTLTADSAFGAKLLSPPENVAAAYTHKALGFRPLQKFHAFDCLTRKFVETEPEPFVALSETLEAQSVLTSPIYYRKQSIGRFFVYSNKVNVFHSSDIPFLLQAIDYFIPIVENIRLVDQMATDAAELERKKIARDIHDSVIQPYIGLQIGIEALSQYAEKIDDKAALDEAFSERIHRLKQLADQGIEDLRNYVHGLTETAARRSAFRDSLSRFAEKFTDGTGIRVEINYAPDLSIRDRLAAEAFQIVAEAMSNVRKHTDSNVAIVSLSSDDSNLILEISNRNDSSNGYEFTPRSIASRTASLGGSVGVAGKDGFTVLRVSIPM